MFLDIRCTFFGYFLKQTKIEIGNHFMCKNLILHIKISLLVTLKTGVECLIGSQWYIPEV